MNGAIVALCWRSLFVEPDQAAEIIGEVSDPDLHRLATEADGTDGQSHAPRPFGEHMLRDRTGVVGALVRRLVAETAALLAFERCLSRPGCRRRSG